MAAIEKIFNVLKNLKAQIEEVTHGNIEICIQDGRVKQVNVKTSYRPDDTQNKR